MVIYSGKAIGKPGWLIIKYLSKSSFRDLILKNLGTDSWDPVEFDGSMQKPGINKIKKPRFIVSTILKFLQFQN